MVWDTGFWYYMWWFLSSECSWAAKCLPQKQGFKLENIENSTKHYQYTVLSCFEFILELEIHNAALGISQLIYVEIDMHANHLDTISQAKA